MKKIVKSLYLKMKPQWPKPKYRNGDQPHFFFLITPPNSGSTAIAKFMDSSPRTMTLTPNGEGQWLVPGLSAGDRWNADKKIDYQSVKSVWLNAYQEKKLTSHEVDVVIEKSPPNMMRIVDLASQFSDVSMLANNRDPYANCSSRLYRYNKEKDINSSRRETILTDLAEVWLRRSRLIREIAENAGVPVLTYEQFCENPSLLLDMVSLPEGVAETISLNAQVKVKDYAVQSIVNQNDRQISDMTSDDIKVLGKVLGREEALLDYFGYKLR